MIGSFWNLCRACPSMPVDKLHSEYRSTYRWHEYTGPRQEVVRRPPQGTVAGVPTSAPGVPAATAAAAGATSSRAVPNRSAEEDTGDGTIAAPRFEPALPRRKKHPELAYRTHEFLAMSEAVGSDDSLDSAQVFDHRARSEDRAGQRIRSSRRSQSEGRRTDHRLHYMKEIASPPARRLTKLRTGSDPNESDVNEQMFAWPRGGRGRAAAGTRAGELATMAVAVPRKSLSMGAIRQGQHPAPVHSYRKKFIDFNRAPDQVPFDLDHMVLPTESSLDVPTVSQADDLRGEEKIQNENVSKEDKPRQRKEFKTEYKKKFRPFSQYDYVEGKFQKKKEKDEMSLPLVMSDLSRSDSWYREVIELRKKAGEYKHRGWGTELVPQHIAELYSKQITLWEQVSRRSSLAALSLASTTPRAITKEEKEKENNKKSSPSKPIHHSALTRTATAQDKSLSDKKKEKNVVEKDGKKSGPGSRPEFHVRHHLDRTIGSMDGALLPSPSREKLEPVVVRQKEDNLTKSPQKASPKSSPRSGRSQSVGPGVSNASDRRSPKRQTRSPSQSAPAPKTAVTAPAPKTAATAPAPKTAVTTPAPKTAVPAPAPKTAVTAQMKEVPPIERRPRPSGCDLSPAGEEVDALAAAAMMKSPPEPTRVKSPEQILMRSPEPVNWTVPLDTGKTFTVTQNVPQGDFAGRPHSEVKAWTPPALPPPAPLSAPPQLPQDWKPRASDDDFTSVNGLYANNAEAEGEGEVEGVEEGEAKLLFPQPTSVAGTTLRCLDDPSEQMCGYGVLGTPLLPPDTHPQAPYRVLEAPSPTSTTNRSMASDVLEKARTRFDNFWGKSKDDKDGDV